MQLGKEEKEGGRRLRQETCGKRVFPEHVGLEARKSRPGASKIEARSLPNRGPDPPKSSPEPSERQFFKTSNLRGSKEADTLFLGGQRGQLGLNSMCCARTAALQGGKEKPK